MRFIEIIFRVRIRTSSDEVVHMTSQKCFKYSVGYRF